MLKLSNAPLIFKLQDQKIVQLFSTLLSSPEFEKLQTVFPYKQIPLPLFQNCILFGGIGEEDFCFSNF